MMNNSPLTGSWKVGRRKNSAPLASYKTYIKGLDASYAQPLPSPIQRAIIFCYDYFVEVEVLDADLYLSV
jgi:hypothetical protein